MFDSVWTIINKDMAAGGKVFNAGDEEVLTVRQVIELVASALDHTLELVSMPYDLATPARPLLAQPLPTHRVLDLCGNRGGWLRRVRRHRKYHLLRQAVPRAVQLVRRQRSAGV